MPDDVVLLNTYTNPHEADLAKMMLESEGILVFLENRFIVEMDWFLSNAIGNIRLKVPQNQAERAAQILVEHARPWAGALSGGGEDDAAEMVRCLNCGVEMGEENDACAECGWSYAESEDHSLNDPDS